MFQLICVNCQKNYLSKTSAKKYCSRICFHSSRVGKTQPKEMVEKRRINMIGKKYDETRRKNIGIGRQTKLTENQLNAIKKFLEFGMPDGYIMNKTGLTTRVFKRYKKELFPLGVPWQCKYLENDIEIFVVEEVVRLSKLKFGYKKIGMLTGIGKKTVKLILKALNKKDSEIKCYSYDSNCWSDRKESTPEKLVREFFDSKKIEYKQESQIESGSKWFFDFQILNTNLLIEVQGDYWHCNPTVYIKPINAYQEWAIRRDFAKRDYAKKLGYNVMPIWEHDLKFNLEAVKVNIERTIEKCKVEL